MKELNRNMGLGNHTAPLAIQYLVKIPDLLKGNYTLLDQYQYLQEFIHTQNGSRLLFYTSLC